MKTRAWILAICFIMCGFVQTVVAQEDADIVLQGVVNTVSQEDAMLVVDGKECIIADELLSYIDIVAGDAVICYAENTGEGMVVYDYEYVEDTIDE